MRLIGIILCLTALGLTGYSALTYKAPQIEADIQSRAAEAVSAVAGGEIGVQADGRSVMLTGGVAGDEQRRQILSAAAAVRGAQGPIDRMERMAVASPYRFSAVKQQEGGVVIEGVAPTDDLKAALESDARAIFGSPARLDIEIAAGAPDGDWRAAVSAALDALATMRQGELTIVDSDVMIEGDVTVEDDLEVIGILAKAVPEGFTWSDDIEVHRRTAEPFTFSVEKDGDNGLRLSGFAPDEETRAMLIDAGKAVAGDRPLIADIQIAAGMPDPEWPALVQAGINAMQEVEAGRFDVVDNDVSYAQGPDATAADSASVSPQPDPASTETPPAASDQAVDAALTPDDSPDDVEAARPIPVLTVDKVEEGVWSIRGVVPDQQAQDRLVAAVREHAGVEDVDVELELAGAGADDSWLRFAADRIRTLGEVRAGRLNLEDFSAHLIGVVETQDDVAPVQAALAAIDRRMTVDLQPVDPRVAAYLDLSMSSDDGVVLNGALPGKLTEDEVLDALGVRRYRGDLGDNGRGPAETWRHYLSEIGGLLPTFEEIELSLGGERPTIRGRVHANRDADVIAEELVLALGRDRRPVIDVEAATTDYQNGATRTNPLTGAQEFYRQGYWLPALDFAADEDTCRQRSSAVLAADKITFLRGKEDLDRRAETILDRLAALAIRCLDGSDLVLEIGGHTDSRGAARMNEELSQARADAVRDALADRGVDAASLVAVGFGEALPIADNATDEGRAANRRITFEWKTPADLPRTRSEG